MTTAARIGVARADLADILRRLPEFTEHMYAPDWQPDTGRSGSNRRSKPAWQGPLTIQQTWADVCAEIHRAHWELGRGTEVPAHCVRFPDQTERARLPDGLHMRVCAGLLDAMLEWAVRVDDGRQADAVRQACEHVQSAKRRIDDLWPEHVSKGADPPMCVTCDERVRARDRRECWACVKRRDRERRAS